MQVTGVIVYIVYAQQESAVCTLPDSQSALHISIMATDTHTYMYSIVHHFPDWFLDTLLIIKFFYGYIVFLFLFQKRKDAWKAHW
jgi:hypothetical protein